MGCYIKRINNMFLAIKIWVINENQLKKIWANALVGWKANGQHIY